MHLFIHPRGGPAHDVEQRPDRRHGRDEGRDHRERDRLLAAADAHRRGGRDPEVERLRSEVNNFD